jgi:glutamate-1-semialdehyde 2,1-aminomutase
LRGAVIGTFRSAGATSIALFEQARRTLAGGVDSPVRAGKPVGAHPPVIANARGSRIIDVDGREYVDYLCAYGPVLLGHGDIGVAAAVRDAAEGGTVVGGTHPEEIRLAERVAGHMPSMERLRFVSTGTEACMSAVRLARSFTGREKIVRFEGNYHGHSDEMIFSAGASSNSAPTLAAGLTRAAADNVIALPYNDPTAVERCLSERGAEIAAVILEPVCANMGLVLPVDGYLPRLRMLTDRAGVVLIFDEIITGFRVGLGGAQGLYDVKPDLTCIGKVLGGGLPIAAFGGRADIMACLAPDGSVFQGGTFSGNPLCVAAAHALLDRLESDPQIHAGLQAMGSRLAEGLRGVFADAHLPYTVVHLGSMVDFMFRPGEAHRTYSQARDSDASAYAQFYWAMLARGIFLAPSQMEVMFLTAAHTVEDVETTIEAARRSLSAAL